MRKIKFRLTWQHNEREQTIQKYTTLDELIRAAGSLNLASTKVPSTDLV